MSRSGAQVHFLIVTMIWSSRAIGAVLGSAAIGISAPSQACSCIPPENVEAAGRAALARADLAAELDIGPAPKQFPSRLWCRSGGRARLWFRPGRKIEQDRAARVLRVIKGRVSGPIRVRGNPIESIGGRCVVQMSSCQISVDAGRTGPLLLRQVAPGVYEPLDVCTQGAFAIWHEQRQAAKGRRMGMRL